MHHDRSIRPAGRVVSATYFVRNFADLKREADRAPVYIETHGKTGWALLSNAQLSALEGAVGGGGLDGRAVLLDMAGAVAALIDADGRVDWANAAMRRLLGIDMGVAPAADDIAAGLAAPYLVNAVDRVAATGQDERFEIDMPVLPGRVFRLTLTRAGDHVAMLGEDVTESVAERNRDAAARGLEHAIDTLPGIARGTINLRGAIDGVHPSLGTMLDTADTTLIGTRLPSLFDVGTRVAVADAVERVLAHGAPISLPALLLVGGATRRPVELSVAPMSSRGRLNGATFLIHAA